MNLKLNTPSQSISGSIILPGSKSISNRVLIIKALSGLDFEIDNLSDSDDTQHLVNALVNYNSSYVIDVGHAGTDMRFLTAFLSLKKGNYELTGSERLQERPMKDLVEILQIMGAQISYKKDEGYPPLLITGGQLIGGNAKINGNISSQFITALLLAAPYFTNGLNLTIVGDLVSKPYVEMTVELMREFGASVSWKDNEVSVKPIPYRYSKKTYVIESDWSAASYYYSLVALSQIGARLKVGALFQNSLQADAVCASIYRDFGINTEYLNNEIIISKVNKVNELFFEYHFIDCPDIAQTLVCTCIGLGQPFNFTGLQTLKVKETDRIIALQNECKKFGIELTVTENSIEWTGEVKTTETNPILIATYNDHRMAMSFATLSVVKRSMIIEDASVVSKSYPLFWEHLKHIGIEIS
jgi:3-phosphoshikimate 1-carboxyvinyltransferase